MLFKTFYFTLNSTSNDKILQKKSIKKTSAEQKTAG